MKKVAGIVVMLALFGMMAGSAGAAAKGMGLGLGINRADARITLDDKSAVDGYVGFNNMGNSNYSQTDFTIGGYYMMKMVNAKPADLHWLGGAEIALTTGDGPKTTQISLFGGIGSEYFLPGTENMSIEVNAGLKFTNMSGDLEGHMFGLDSLNGVTFRYYF